MISKRKQLLLSGFVFSNLFAFILIGLTKILVERPAGSSSGVMIFSEFVIIPIMMGVICAWFWKDLALTSASKLGHLVTNSFLAIFLSSVFLQEGVICLVIVSPLILGFMWLGLFSGIVMFNRGNDTINVSIVAALMLVFLADARSNHSYQNEVSDEILINAPVEKIWKNVVAFEPIRQKNKFWLFRIGMPSPMQTTVTGYYKGAGRKCIFSNGYVFGEKIVTYDENHDLTFDIVNQPRDPEIMGHIDILRGQFLLHDNGNGTTALIGNSWYKLYVFPVWYYDAWAQSITRNVHLRVMEHIKELSEKP